MGTRLTASALGRVPGERPLQRPRWRKRAPYFRRRMESRLHAGERSLLPSREMFGSSSGRNTLPAEAGTPCAPGRLFPQALRALRIGTTKRGCRVGDRRSGSQVLRPPRMETISPTITVTVPPTSNHIDRSVGLPVKNRDTSELAECDSLKPKINSTAPRPKMAKPTMLFIVQCSSDHVPRQWGVYLSSGLKGAIQSRPGMRDI